MMRQLHALQHALPLLFSITSTVLGKEDKYYNAGLNYRPENITGLDYYYYPWKGSYYNGTVAFTISSISFREDYNYDDEKLCSRLSNDYTYTFSYPGLLGITPTEGGDERPQNTNPLNVILSTSYSNFTKYFSDYNENGSMQIRDEFWIFESIDFSGVGGSPFRVLGTSDFGETNLLGFRMNMSSCTNSVSWWDAQWASEDWDDDEIDVENATLTLTFDSHSANFMLQGYIYAQVLNKDEEEETLPIDAKIKVEFLGNHDDARSDILNEGVPVSWTSTVGFGNNSANIDYETGGAGPVYGMLPGGLVWGLVGFVVGVGFL
ncbi:hypothetical protein N7481_001294 [Penicillium waksmanii]|uniref:uncharacterized protein n=1 Tax=Penicillium waksmanii TaxID=69791 RepID=UPI00254940DA|nr:uncharacterized protein N7481_001294 [Penicillium waksmanii]KAJ6000885.1 hypothetical protein N7481_001294 [Penicillium waksmanii]